MYNRNLTEEAEKEIRMTLKRCRPEVIDAALDYRKGGDSVQASAVVLGIIERFLEPESRVKLNDTDAEHYRLIDDLGVDSLVMVEIVMTIEEILQLSIPNEDLKELSTIMDINTYIRTRINTFESIPEHANV